MRTKEFLHEVMSLAWQFVRRNGFTMSEAMRVAWANMKLKAAMKNRIVKFYFKKGAPHYASQGLELFTIDSKKYAFNERGEMQTGLQQVNTGENETANFYFGEDGVMKTGKQVIYDEELGGGSLLIAQMLSATGKVDLAGNHAKLKRKEEIKRRWVMQLLDVLHQTEAETGRSAAGPEFRFEELPDFRNRFYAHLRQLRPDFEDNQFNTARIAATKNEMQTLTVATSSLTSYFATNYGPPMAAATLSFPVPFILYCFMQKQFVEGIALGGVKG